MSPRTAPEKGPAKATERRHKRLIVQRVVRVEAGDLDRPPRVHEEPSTPEDSHVPHSHSRTAEEDQVTGLAAASRHGLAEPELLVGVPRQRDVSCAQHLL